MPKLGSTKSRSGCYVCKRRHVKCDEARPVCGACDARADECSYPTPEIPPQAPGPQLIWVNARSNRRSSPTRVNESTPTSGDAPAERAANTNVQTALTQSYSLKHLELFHIFITRTTKSFCPIKQLHIWQDIIPTYAYERHWLMLGMIAVASLQRAHDVPASAPYFTSMAIDAMNFGLPKLRSMVSQGVDPSEENAIFVYAALVSIYSIALPAVQYHDQPPPDPLNALLDSFELLRGVPYIFRYAGPQVRNGPLKALADLDVLTLDFWPEEDNPATNPQARQLLDRMKTMRQLLDDLNNVDGVNSVGDQRAAACILELGELNRHIQAACIPGSQLTNYSMLSWSSTLTLEFLGLIRSNYAPALTILGYSCLLLRQDSWWTKGWRFWILKALCSLVDEQPWLRLIRWAQDQTGRYVEFMEICQREAVPRP